MYEELINKENFPFLEEVLGYMNLSFEDFKVSIVEKYGNVIDKEENNNQHVFQAFSQVFNKLSETNNFLRESELETIFLSLEEDAEKVPYIEKLVKNLNSNTSDLDLEGKTDKEIEEIKKIVNQLEEDKKELEELEATISTTTDNKLKEKLQDYKKPLVYSIAHKTFTINNLHLERYELAVERNKHLENLKTQEIQKQKNALKK
jgi:hypothetical protein